MLVVSGKMLTLAHVSTKTGSSVTLSKTHRHSPSGKESVLTDREMFVWTCVGLVERRGTSFIDDAHWHLGSPDFL